MRLRIAAALAVGVSPLAAQNIDTDLLEQPGVVWVAADLHPIVRREYLGVTIPYMTFQDGEGTGGFLSINYLIADSTSCDTVWDCPKRAPEAIVYHGEYDLADGVLTTASTPATDWIIEHPELSDQIIELHPMARDTADFSTDGDAIVHTGPDGELRFLPMPVEHRFAALAVVITFEQSVRDTYVCTAQTMYDLYSTPESEWSEAQLRLDATARLGRLLNDLRQQQQILFEPALTGSLEEQEMRQYEQSRTEEAALSMALGLMLSDLSGGETRMSAPISDETMGQIADAVSRLAERAPDPGAVQTRVDMAYPDIELTAHMLAAVSTHDGGLLAGYLDQVCGQ